MDNSVAQGPTATESWEPGDDITAKVKAFNVIQIILITIQIVIPLLLLAPHGYLDCNYFIKETDKYASYCHSVLQDDGKMKESDRKILNGYQMDRIAYPVSAIIFMILSIINLSMKDKRVFIQVLYIILHIILLFFVLINSLKGVCIDMCTAYMMTDSIPGFASFILYLGEFWLIVASLVIATKIR